MDSNNPANDIFQKRLYHAEVPPPDFVWANIEEELRKKRRKFLVWWWAGGASALLVTGLIGWMLAQPAPKAPVRIAPAPPAQPAQTLPDNPVPAPLTAQTATPTRTPDYSPATRPLSVLPHTQNPTPQPRPMASPSAIPMLALEEIPRRSIAEIPRKKAAIQARKQVPFPKIKKEPKNCYDFENHPKVWFADAYAGPVFAKRELSITDPTQNDYLAQRLSTESPLLAYHAGLRASLLLGRHFLLRGGVHYEQMTEVFEYADPLFIEYTVKVRTELVDGAWMTITDTVDVNYGEHYTKSYNRYSRLELPVSAGFELRRGRTGLSVHGGGSVNLYRWQTGKILSTAGSPISLDDVPDNTFRTRTGFSFVGSVQGFYHLRPRLRIFAEPYIRFDQNAISGPDTPVEQHYTISGIKIGLSRILQ